MSKHLERAEKWMFERDDVDDLTSLAALLAEVENEALERAAAVADGWNFQAGIAIRALKEPK